MAKKEVINPGSPETSQEIGPKAKKERLAGMALIQTQQDEPESDSGKRPPRVKLCSFHGVQTVSSLPQDGNVVLVEESKEIYTYQDGNLGTFVGC